MNWYRGRASQPTHILSDHDLLFGKARFGPRHNRISLNPCAVERTSCFDCVCFRFCPQARLGTELRLRLEFEFY